MAEEAVFLSLHEITLALPSNWGHPRNYTLFVGSVFEICSLSYSVSPPGWLELVSLLSSPLPPKKSEDGHDFYSCTAPYQAQTMARADLSPWVPLEVHWVPLVMGGCLNLTWSLVTIEMEMCKLICMYNVTFTNKLPPPA